MLDHLHVIDSPIAKDTRLIRNRETGEKEQVGKILIEISVCELHNDLLTAPDQGGLAEARDSN